MAEQTAAILSQIDALLAEAGTDKTKILTAQIWLSDIATQFAAMNAVWDALGARGPWPRPLDRRGETGNAGL